jgi:DNA-binding NarL/FixJ family response regulator
VTAVATKIKIALVDDHQMVREGFADLLELTENWFVMMSCASYEEAMTQFVKKHIDVAIVDISLPDKSGLELALLLNQQYPHIKVIIVSMFEHHHFIQQALQNGALGYISKQAAANELIDAISTVLKGEVYLSEEIRQNIEANSSNDLIRRLTTRELDVFKLIALGNNPKQISKVLNVDPKTVFTHRTNIYRKLDLKSPFEALKYAVKLGVVPLESLFN